MFCAADTPRRQDQIIGQMPACITADPVPERPKRSEPRARRRRPKNYQLLTKPRRQTGNLLRRRELRGHCPQSPMSRRMNTTRRG
jgi:hypothetical protein